MKLSLLIIALLIFLFACQSNNTKKKRIQAKHSTESPGTVTNIVDGDTFDMADINGNIIRIRPIGINTDEMHDNSHGKKGPFAQQAKDYLTQLIYNKQVRLEMDIQKKDKWKRILAYVFVDDSLFVNAEMVKQGLAVIETEPPNVKYADYFYQLQQQARGAGLGMWKQ